MSEPVIHRWEQLTKERFDEIDRERAIVVVTCSPMEVHGPHLPLGADALQGMALAERAIRFLPEEHRQRPFLQLPMIYAATDPVPQAGSLAFRTSTVVAMLEDLGHSLAVQGFEDVLVSNFHGSPRHFLAIETACDRVAKRHGIRMASLFSIMLTRLDLEGSELGSVLGHLPGVEPADFDGDTHGGLVETSQLLALHPGWVDPGYAKLPRSTVETWRAERGEEAAQRSRDEDGPVSFPAMVADFKSTLHYFADRSYSGAPAKASAELGEGILDVLASKAAEAITELLEGELPRERRHSPLWKLRHLFVPTAAVRFFDRLLAAPKAVG